MEKKRPTGGYSPSQNSAPPTSSVCTVPAADLPRTTLTAALLPFSLCYTADIFAQYLPVCPALFGFAQTLFTWSGTTVIISLFFNQKPKGQLILLTDFRGVYPFLRSEGGLRNTFSLVVLTLVYFFQKSKHTMLRGVDGSLMLLF